MTGRWIIRDGRTNVRLSGPLSAEACVKRCAALIRTGRVLRVLSPEAEAERRMARRVGYRLPAGLNWATLAEKRRTYGFGPRSFPLVSTRGVTAWGVPLAKQQVEAEIAQRLDKAAEYRAQGCKSAALMELIWVRRLRLTGHWGAFFGFVDCQAALSLMERMNRAELQAA